VSLFVFGLSQIGSLEPNIQPSAFPIAPILPIESITVCSFLLPSTLGLAQPNNPIKIISMIKNNTNFFEFNTLSIYSTAT
ncbi:uncharacterized protein METZ01_LOCUS455202, partial [marine metagenome]